MLRMGMVLMMLSALAVAACGDDDEAETDGSGGTTSSGGTPGAGAPGTGGAGATGGPGGGGGASSVPEAPAPFGDTCVEPTDCEAPAAFCARNPTADSGYCTADGCETDASVCPEGWACVSFGGVDFCADPE